MTVLSFRKREVLLTFLSSPGRGFRQKKTFGWSFMQIFAPVIQYLFVISLLTSFSPPTIPFTHFLSTGTVFRSCWSFHQNFIHELITHHLSIWFIFRLKLFVTQDVQTTSLPCDRCVTHLSIISLLS